MDHIIARAGVDGGAPSIKVFDTDTMNKDNAKALLKAQEEAQVQCLAAECIKKCDGAGGVTCTPEGIIRVAEAMIKHIKEANKINNLFNEPVMRGK